MTVVRVKGVKHWRDKKTGRRYSQHRKTGEMIKQPFGSAEFFVELARLNGLVEMTPGAKPGTLGMLVGEYRLHASFTDLATRTRADYESKLDYLRPIFDTPLVRFDKALVVRIMDKAAIRGRRHANYVKAVLSIVFGWAVQRGYMPTNPAAEIKNIRRKRDQPEANRPWSDEEREAVLGAAPAHMLPALALMMFTGLGPKDALRLPRNAYHSGEIATRRSKTGEPVFWPVIQILDAIFSAAPTHDAITLVANSRGRPWTESGFRSSWEPVRKALEQTGRIGPGLTLYGLRRTVAVIYRESGADERTIADALGQKTIEMARHYAKGADLRRKMTGAVADFEREVNARRTRNVKPE